MFVCADHLNTPRVLIDKNDATRWRWIGEPFGTTAPEQSPSGLSAVTYNLRFFGQFFDSESGLHYNYFRDYDATTGRYVQSDPIALAGGINTYAHVRGEPAMEAYTNGTSNALPIEKNADQLLRDLMNGVCPCE